MKQLIVFFGAIGDTILFAPAIQKLSRNVDISVVGYPERMVLLKKVGWVEKIYDADTIDFDSFFSEPSPKLFDFITKFDAIYFFIRDGKKLEKIAKSIGVPNVYYFPGIPPNNWNRHASIYYLQCFGFRPDKTFILPIQPKKIHNEVIIHPGSGSKKKNFSVDFFLEITKQLHDNHLKVRWCLGPAEKEFSIPREIPTLEIEDLTKLAEYIAGASAYIGNDSGISHLAGAIGVKTIVFFRSTDPGIWSPLGPRVFTFTTKTLCIDKILKIVSTNPV